MSIFKFHQVSMFNEHMERHSPRSETDQKCPYCDYWVAANRLLHQHIKLHQQDNIAAANAMTMNGWVGNRKLFFDKKSLYYFLYKIIDCPVYLLAPAHASRLPNQGWYLFRNVQRRWWNHCCTTEILAQIRLIWPTTHGCHRWQIPYVRKYLRMNSDMAN